MSDTWSSDKPVVNKLPGDRLNLRHGPINIVLRVWGGPDAMRQAQRLVFRNFPKILPAIVDDLERLKKPIGKKPSTYGSPVAQRMAEATSALAEDGLTPMAAMPGAIADEVLRMVMAAGEVIKAYVNNAGNVALHLAPGQSVSFGDDGDFTLGTAPKLKARIGVSASSGVRGIASAGLDCAGMTRGIANCVTVMGPSASNADAAAAVIANHVDVESTAIKRTPAKKLEPDSDLGAALVTTTVGPLTPDEISRALDAGVARAEALLRAGYVIAARLDLKGDIRHVGPGFLP